MFQKTLLATCALSGLLLAQANAYAIAVTDAMYEGEYADGATLTPGNHDASSVNTFGGGPWSLLDKTDGASTEFQGVTFTLSTETTSSPNTYDFKLSWAQTGTPGLPIWMDFALVVKATNDFGTFLFEDVQFTDNPTTGSGTFEITWTTNGNQIPDLSHGAIYGRTTTAPIDQIVPEPGMLALFGLGLAGLCLRKRKA